jgi:hypothetical protein
MTRCNTPLLIYSNLTFMISAILYSDSEFNVINIYIIKDFITSWGYTYTQLMILVIVNELLTLAFISHASNVMYVRVQMLRWPFYDSLSLLYCAFNFLYNFHHMGNCRVVYLQITHYRNWNIKHKKSFRTRGNNY